MKTTENLDSRDFSQGWDEFHRQATEVVDMGASTIDLLLKFLQQNDGRLSKRAREREFSALTEPEISAFEGIFSDLSA